jgi:hypothetical protein
LTQKEKSSKKEKERQKYILNERVKVEEKKRREN